MGLSFSTGTDEHCATACKHLARVKCEQEEGDVSETGNRDFRPGRRGESG